MRVHVDPREREREGVLRIYVRILRTYVGILRIYVRILREELSVPGMTVSPLCTAHPSITCGVGCGYLGSKGI